MSLRAIAKYLGISVTTVSRALNGYDDVSAETRARVESEAKRRGYRPNTFARRLKMGKTDAIGFVFPEPSAPLTSSIFMDMVNSISRELSRHEIDLLLISDNEQADQHGYIRLVQSGRVDALILAHILDNDPRLHYLQQSGIPFLALGRSQPITPYAWFDFDNKTGTYLATQHLIALGHRRIVLLSEDNNRAYVMQRRQGWLKALSEHQIVDKLLCPVLPTRRAGYHATMKLLSLPESPTAIIADGHLHGEGAAMALQISERLAGESPISLVVYDGLPPDSIVENDVAAVRQSSREEVGIQIASMVRRLAAGEAAETLQVLWEPTFYPGNTLNPPAHR